MSDSLRQDEVLKETAHRPWPLPEEPWFMGQSWLNLLFAHWAVPPEAIEEVIPSQIPLDVRDGSAWLGITPFAVSGVRLRGTPPVPRLSSFPEINVRTYVKVDERPGIYFLSLDADSAAAVFAARRLYRLPYFRSQITLGSDGEGWDYRAKRVSDDGAPAEFQARYGPKGERLSQQPGSLAHWLTERYCLYTLDEERQVYRAEIHHSPWPLRRAWAEIGVNTMTVPHGLELEGSPLLHFSARQDAALWRIRRV